MELNGIEVRQMIFYWTKVDVATAAKVTPHTVKTWGKRGYITPAARTPHGVRLYDPKVVKAFLAERKLRQDALAARRRQKGAR